MILCSGYNSTDSWIVSISGGLYSPHSEVKSEMAIFLNWKSEYLFLQTQGSRSCHRRMSELLFTCVSISELIFEIQHHYCAMLWKSRIIISIKINIPAISNNFNVAERFWCKSKTSLWTRALMLVQLVEAFYHISCRNKAFRTLEFAIMCNFFQKLIVESRALKIFPFAVDTITQIPYHI